MRWSRAASKPSLIIRRRVGWPIRTVANGVLLSMSWLVSMRTDSSWAWSRRCASSMISTGGPASFCGLAGEHVVGLGGRGGGAVGGPAAEGGDDVVVDAADAGGGVADVDDGVPGGVRGRQGGADRHRLAGADFAGEHAEGFLGDGPGDAGGGLGVGGVPVQCRGGEVTAER